jgi:hypothetical protein
MKNIIVKFIIFISIFFLLDNLLYQALSQLWRNTDFIYNKVISGKPDVIFFGDSKTRYGIVSDIAAQKIGMRAYNVARYGSGIAYSKGVQNIILSHYRPKLFVMQYMSLSLEREAAYSLAPYLGNNELKQMLSNYPSNVKVKFELFKTFRFNSQVLTMLYRLFNDYDPYNGYVPLYGVSGIDRTENFNERLAPNFKLEIGKSLLKEFIEEAKKNNIKVIMLAMPVLKRDEFESYDIYKRIAKEYSVPFLDFTQTNLLALDYFWDSNHLNDNGAKKFSSFLGEEIKRLLEDKNPR